MRQVLTVLIFLTLLSACTKPHGSDLSSPTASTFSGSSTCKNCHNSEHEAWLGSHHQLAMRLATDASVLGDFSGVDFEYYETVTRFFRRGDAFIVLTDNQSGARQEFEVTHTFGVEPLQEYLVDLPGGRKQALPFAWDNRPADDGGQRWYHLYPEEYISPQHALHWTGRYFSWNTMCAECHSTDVDVAYDPHSDTFDSSFFEVSVGCEACHGPGSRHLEQARQSAFDSDFGLAVNLRDLNSAPWMMNPETGIAGRKKAVESPQQVESCGRCHSRRSVLTQEYEFGTRLTDTHMPALLDDQLYFADGRIQDEVYVYGSFLQSKMYRAGVVCSNCHNPHSGDLVTGPKPNDVCAQCHLTEKFTSPMHADEQTGDCVSCHMPATTYMGIDERRDHSFRIPGAGKSEQHFGPAIAAGRAGYANKVLLGMLKDGDQPAIANATALTLLQDPLDADGREILLEQLSDPDPLVRIGALRAMRQLSADIRLQSGTQLLHDSVRAVRIEAALSFADYRDLLAVADARAYAAAADEYREAMQASLSFPESALNLAEFESRSGNFGDATVYYEHAIKLDPSIAALHHAYGLHMVRVGDHAGALHSFREAVTLQAENSRYVYVLGVALNSLGYPTDAIVFMQQARADFQGDFDIAWALATMLRDASRAQDASQLLREMSQQFPGNSDIEILLDEVSQAAIDVHQD